MKRNAYKTLAAITILSLCACGEQNKKQGAAVDQPKVVDAKTEVNSEPLEVSFSDDKTTKIFEDYLKIKSALTASDVSNAKTAAGTLGTSIAEEDATIKTLAMQISTSDDLEKQRKLFSDLTTSLEPLLKDNITKGTIYKQFCPMAFNSTGGYWLSNSDQIRNPYFGDKMLRCGKVASTIL